MTSRDQLEQAIAILDQQRTLLGDAVVDAALAPMRAQLTLLHTAQASAIPAQRKVVTVLFVDVSGFTALSSMLDPEEITTMMNDLWNQLDAVILEHGGAIDKHIGDAVMAVWGIGAAQEDDAERAIRARL